MISKWMGAIAVAALGMGAAADSQAADCIGNCGTSGANGVVGLSPSGASSYTWVSTDLGQFGGGVLPGFGGTTGSTLLSDPFFAPVGATVEFWFNYITSDGSDFADYGWSQLRSTTGGNTTTLFTARTRPTGSIVPGFGLPGVNAVLTPASVAITPGGPGWAPLGGSSGQCWDAGCGHTGWVQSRYEVQTAGTYQLAFGVTNWTDDDYDSGMAFDGLLLNGFVIGDGSSPESPLLPIGIGPGGAFEFVFVPTPGVPVFIDPLVAVGYDYAITAGGNTMLSAIFPVLASDPDGYEIYTLDDISPAGLLGTVAGGVNFSFGAGVTGFSLRGISEEAMLDPTNPTAFVTGLVFATAALVSMTQLPVSVNVVPEPASVLMLLAGLGMIGRRMAVRRRQG